MNIIILPQNLCVVNVFLQKKLHIHSYFLIILVIFGEKAQISADISNTARRFKIFSFKFDIELAAFAIEFVLALWYNYVNIIPYGRSSI